MIDITKRVLQADWVVTPVVAKDAPAPKPVIVHRVCNPVSALLAAASAPGGGISLPQLPPVCVLVVLSVPGRTAAPVGIVLC